MIDEIGYVAYGNRHADLLFEIVSRRYERKAIIVTTNQPFAEWGDVFPNAPCAVSLINRLIHHARGIGMEGESYRLKEARERVEHNGTAKSAKTRATHLTQARRGSAMHNLKKRFALPTDWTDEQAPAV